MIITNAKYPLCNTAWNSWISQTVKNHPGVGQPAKPGSLAVSVSAV